MVTQANTALEQIKKEVRSQTGSPSQQALTDSELEQAINLFYSTSFPSAIKTDQLRDVYTIFTKPNVDLYPLDVNTYQSVRSQAYVEGRQAALYKDRGSFFRVYPREPQLQQPVEGDGTTTSFSFTLGVKPFLPTMVVMGSQDVNGNVVQIVDNGGQGTTTGALLLLSSDNVGNFDPAIPPTSPIPSTLPSNQVGTVNYVTGAVSLDLPIALASSEKLKVWTAPYQANFPSGILFWNNEFTVRPVPDKVYKIEVEVFKKPTQFLSDTSETDVQQWSQYIALGASLIILRNRQDMESVENLLPFFQEQEGYVMARQSCEEIGQHNDTWYTSPPTPNYNYWGAWW